MGDIREIALWRPQGAAEWGVAAAFLSLIALSIAIFGYIAIRLVLGEWPMPPERALGAFIVGGVGVLGLLGAGALFDKSCRKDDASAREWESTERRSD